MKDFADKYAHILIGLIPVTIYVISYYLFEINAESSFTIKKMIVGAVKEHSVKPSLTIIEYKSRMIWLSSSLLSIIAYCTALTWSVTIFFRCCRRNQMIMLLVIGLVLLKLSLLHVIYLDSESAMFNSIFDTTYQAMSESALISQSSLKKVFSIISIVNILAAVTPIFILLAVCSSLAMPLEVGSISLQYFKERMGFVIQGIMIGSLILLFGIIHMNVWMQWPIPMIDDNDIKNAAEQSFAVVSQFWGIAFSLLLICFYASVSFFWRYQTRIFLQATKPEIEAAIWFEENGFTFSWQKYALQLSAMLTPFLAGSFNTGMELLSLN